MEKYRIDKNSDIFKSEEYQKDKYMFSVIEENLNLDNIKLYSNERDFIVCQSGDNRPVWIWTKNEIEKEELEIIKKIMAIFINNGTFKFTVKKNVYDYLKLTGFEQFKLNENDYFEMGALECHELKLPKKCDGYIDRPKKEELDIIAKYWHDDCDEMLNADPITMEEAYEHAEELINLDTFFVWRNDDGKIVSMIKYKVSNGLAKLNHVYTPIEERRKGYAANLVYTVTKDMLDKGYGPLLYTDYNYLPSNKSYMNVGYNLTGMLINFSCVKK